MEMDSDQRQPGFKRNVNSKRGNEKDRMMIHVEREGESDVGILMAKIIRRDGERQGAMMSALHQSVSSCLQSQHALLSHLAS